MEENVPSYVPGNRYRIAISVLVGVISAVVLYGLVNHLAAGRLRWRQDFSSTGRVGLSPLTQQVLGNLTNDVTVTVLFPRTSDLYGHIDGMLREYSEAQSRVQVRLVDPEAEPVTAMQLRTSYKLSPEESNLVVFEANGQVIRISEPEFSSYDANINALLQGQQREVRRAGFKGEMLFTSALAGLATTNVASACFVIGHDEARPDSEDRLTGYYRFASLVASKSAVVTTLRLDGTNDVPTDCRLLVIPGPSQPFLPVEVERLTRFLDGGGRVLLLLDSGQPTLRLGLERLLFEWGVVTPPAYAVDTNRSLGGLSVLSTNFGSHPITLPLARKEVRLFFQRPRVVGTLGQDQRPADAPKAVVLVATGPEGMTKSDLRAGTVAFKPGLDGVGEIPMAAAVEQGGVTGVAAGRGTARMVVVGDSMVFGNDAFSNPGNVDFAELTLAWLLDRTELLAIGPKPIREYRLYLTPAQYRSVRWMLLGVLPGSVLLLGFLVWFRRRQ